jgi:hypothetical protein
LEGYTFHKALVAHAYNPSYLRLRLEGSHIDVSVGKMFMGPHFNQWLSILACTCHPTYVGS